MTLICVMYELQFNQKPNRICRLTGGPVFHLEGTTSVSIIRKPNFEKNQKTEPIGFS
jgi:hypothetical protein